MHVLTPGLMSILESRFAAGDPRGITLSGALAELAGREQYLALEQSGRRFNVGAHYGMLQAQLALSLAGRDRYQVLASLLELVAASAHGSGTDKA
jgi:UTP--glucose-1-phosphate uridylyltransferase